MNAKLKWSAVAAAAALAGWFLLRPQLQLGEHGEQPGAPAPHATPTPTPTPSGDPNAGQRHSQPMAPPAGAATAQLPGGQPVPAQQTGKTFPTEPGPDPAAVASAKAHYRPATYLRFSAGEPARDPGADAANPSLLRMLALVKADPEQEAQIRDLWKQHEDGRRALVPVNRRMSGPTMLNPEKLRELDGALRAALFSKVLRPEQAERLALELPPADAPPQVTEMYDMPGPIVPPR
jgi:hypothetical protein